MTSTFAPGRFIFNGGNDPRYAQSWITAPSLIALDDAAAGQQPQWPMWALRWLALIGIVGSISQMFSSAMPLVNVALIAPDDSDAAQTRARVALLMFDLGIFSFLACAIVLCSCSCCHSSRRPVLSVAALWAVQILALLEGLSALLRAILAAVFLVADAHIVASQDPLWLLLCHRFASLLAALALLASIIVVARTAKIAARPANARSYTKLDDFR